MILVRIITSIMSKNHFFDTQHAIIHLDSDRNRGKISDK